jgi:hypothetical protein
MENKMTTGELPKEKLRSDKIVNAASLEAEKELEDWRKKTSAIGLEGEIKKPPKELVGGANKVFFVEFADDERGIFKPASGEFPYAKKYIERGTLHKRERAAYLVDYFLGFGIVPPTISREIDGEAGSVQRFVPDAAPYSDIWKFSMPDKKSFQDQMKTLWIFDLLIHSSDRRPVNLLFSGFSDEPARDIALHAIDNGCSFSKDEGAFAAEFFDEEIPQEPAIKIKEFAEDKHKQEILRVLLLELLSENEVNAFFARMKKMGEILAEHGKIPAEKKEEILSF